jgi:hypothetical protein
MCDLGLMLDLYIDIYVILDDRRVNLVNFVEVHGLQGHGELFLAMSDFVKTVIASTDWSFSFFAIN